MFEGKQTVGPSAPVPRHAGADGMTRRRVGFPVGIGLRDPRSQKRDLGHPSVSPFDIAEGTSFVISLRTRGFHWGSVVTGAVSWEEVKILPGFRRGLPRTRSREHAGEKRHVGRFARRTDRRCFHCRKLPSPRVLEGPEYPYRKATSISSVRSQESLVAVSP
jgi:hypothetical protein